LQIAIAAPQMARHGVFIVNGYVGMVFLKETAPNK
jgi:hypothetical protein